VSAVSLALLLYICAMKWLMIFFSCYILALSATPCFDQDCCKNENSQSPRSHNESQAPCSPFFICSSCHGFVIPESGIELQKPEPEISKLTISVLILHLSGYCSVAWEPPRNC